jgi:hypothetical protein
VKDVVKHCLINVNKIDMILGGEIWYRKNPHSSRQVPFGYVRMDLEIKKIERVEWIGGSMRFWSASEEPKAQFQLTSRVSVLLVLDETR